VPISAAAVNQGEVAAARDMVRLLPPRPRFAAAFPTEAALSALRDSSLARAYFHYAVNQGEVATFKSRWRIERGYEDLKGELGLDHYEGRSFIGWHHHVTVVLACYAFLVAEHARSFPPPRPNARCSTVRSNTRPERHFHDSLVTLRIAIVRALLARWLPRCPCCLRAFGQPSRPRRKTWDQ
jgi:hypothetical protein